MNGLSARTRCNRDMIQSLCYNVGDFLMDGARGIILLLQAVPVGVGMRGACIHPPQLGEFASRVHRCVLLAAREDSRLRASIG